jgi:hypothetical protein
MISSRVAVEWTISYRLENADCVISVLSFTLLVEGGRQVSRVGWAVIT